MPKRKTDDYVRLFEAYAAVTEGGMSLQTACVKYNIPERTLHDRVTGKVPFECVTVRPDPIFTWKQENLFSKHLEKMASFGYGFSRKEVCILASEYAFLLRLRNRDKPLGSSWFKGFARQHPDVIKATFEAREIKVVEAYCVSTVQSYFENLKKTLQKYGLLDKPHLIYNVDEKGLTADCSSPNPGTNTIPSKKSFADPQQENDATIFAAGNAIGNYIPPYFVFRGVKFDPTFIEHGTPRVDGTMTPTGSPNSEVFKKYILEHFLSFVPRAHPSQPLLIIYNGHKSHITPDIVRWFEEYKIILFILPAHMNNFLQPLTVSCFEPFESMFTTLKHDMSLKKSTLNHPEICKLACTAYLEATQPYYLFSGFRKTGISPFTGMDAIDIGILLPLKSRPTTLPSKAEDNITTAAPYHPAQSHKRNNVAEISQESKERKRFSKTASQLPASSVKTKRLKPNPESSCCQCLQEAPPVYSEDASNQIDWMEGSFVVDWAQCTKCSHQVHSGICVPDADDVDYVCPCCDES